MRHFVLNLHFDVLQQFRSKLVVQLVSLHTGLVITKAFYETPQEICFELNLISLGADWHDCGI